MATKKLLYAMVSAETGARLVFASSSSVYGARRHIQRVKRAPAANLSLRCHEGVRRATDLRVCGTIRDRCCDASILHRVRSAAEARYGLLSLDKRFPEWPSAHGVRRRFGRPRLHFRGRCCLRYGRSARNSPGDLQLAGGSPASVNEAMTLIAELTDREIELRRMLRAKRDPSRTGGDVSRIMNAMEWKPETSLREGLGHQIEWVTRKPD